MVEPYWYRLSLTEPTQWAKSLMKIQKVQMPIRLDMNCVRAYLKFSFLRDQIQDVGSSERSMFSFGPQTGLGTNLKILKFDLLKLSENKPKLKISRFGKFEVLNFLDSFQAYKMAQMLK